MNRQRLNLLAEIHELEELLTLVPKDSLIEKVSLKSRLEKVKEDLELLQDSECSSHKIDDKSELEDVVCAINNLTKEVQGNIKELTIYLKEQINEVKETCKICSRQIYRIAKKMEEQEELLNDCDSLGGKISFTSKLNEGTCFNLEFPRACIKT